MDQGAMAPVFWIKMAGDEELYSGMHRNGKVNMDNVIEGLSFSLFFSSDFEDSDTATEIVSIFLSSDVSVRPVKYGVFGPEERVEDKETVASILINARGPKRGPRSGSLILERNSGCGYQIQWNKSDRPGFSFIGGHLMFSLYRNDVKVRDDFIILVKDLVTRLSPVYGEIRSMAAPGWDVPIDLLKRLPDIPPVSIYGEDYIEHFSLPGIEAAPFLVKERVGNCYWLVASNTSEQSVPDGVRSSIRVSLGERSFMANGKWRYADGDAPRFDLAFSLCE